MWQNGRRNGLNSSRRNLALPLSRGLPRHSLTASPGEDSLGRANVYVSGCSGSVHLLVNALLLFWIAGILEKRMGIAVTGAIYLCSVLSSAFVILLVHSWYPKPGATHESHPLLAVGLLKGCLSDGAQTGGQYLDQHLLSAC
jgi:hypothetical protein